MNNIKPVTTNPLSFNEIMELLQSTFESEYKALTGENITLSNADEEMIILKSVAMLMSQGFLYTEHMAQQNMLKTATGKYLDNIAETRANLTRLPATKAVTKLQFALEENTPTDVLIPKGTRVSAGDEVYFETDNDLTITTNQKTGTVNATCTTEGIKGNGYEVGALNVIVDPVAFVSSVSNTETTQVGAETESDDDFRNRIYNNPKSLSVAGPQSAYEYLIKNYSGDISDCYVSSPLPGQVDIRVLLKGGELPNNAVLERVEQYISGKDKRPLTDKVTVSAPTTVDYAVNLTYYIDSENADREQQIKESATQQINDYVMWQKSKIARDINPDELTRRLLNVGVKRVVITSPVFAKVGADKVAKDTAITVNYGGLEDE